MRKKQFDPLYENDRALWHEIVTTKTFTRRMTMILLLAISGLLWDAYQTEAMTQRQLQEIRIEQKASKIERKLLNIRMDSVAQQAQTVRKAMEQHDLSAQRPTRFWR